MSNISKIIALWDSIDFPNRNNQLENLPELERKKLAEIVQTILLQIWGDLPKAQKAKKLALLAEGIELANGEPQYESLINAEVFEDLTGIDLFDFFMSEEALQS